MIKIINKKSIRYFAIAALLVFLYFIGVLRPVENIARSVLNPIFSSAHNVGTRISAPFYPQDEEGNLQSELEKLKQENNELIVRLAELENLKEENKALKESLYFTSDNDFDFVLSRVISRGNIADISGQTETIIIDQGRNGGIEVGELVVNSDGVVVGKIAQLKDNIAEVYLLNNKKCKVATMVLGKEQTAGISEGELGLTIRMGFIPQDEEINVGDTIVTSGLEANVPRGLVIGKVIEVERESNELWQSARIESLVNLNGLIIVSVLKP